MGSFLQDKTVLITGGTGSFGTAAAKRFLSLGFRLRFGLLCHGRLFWYSRCLYRCCNRLFGRCVRLRFFFFFFGRRCNTVSLRGIEVYMPYHLRLDILAGVQVYMLHGFGRG